MQLNQPYDPRYNAKLYVPKINEEQRLARATPLENLRSLRFRTETQAAPAAPSPTEPAVPTPLPTHYASADPPLPMGAIASDAICGESSEPRLPVIPTNVGIQKPSNVNALKSRESRMRGNDSLPESLVIPSRYHSPAVQPAALKATVPTPVLTENTPAPYYIPTAREVLFAEFPELFPFPYQEANCEAEENSVFSESCRGVGPDEERPRHNKAPSYYLEPKPRPVEFRRRRALPASSSCGRTGRFQQGNPTEIVNSNRARLPALAFAYR